MAQRPVFWQKRVLVPFWIVRICIMILIIAVYGYSLRNVNDLKEVIQPSVGSVVVFILFIVIVLLIDILAIVMFLGDKLKPGTFLTMNCFQTGFWTGVLIMDFVAIGHGASAVGIGFSIFVFLTFLGLLIYAIAGYRRAKKEAQRGQYAPAHNPVAAATAAQSSPYNSLPEYQQNTAYHSQTQPDMHNQYLPPYQGGAATDYYQQPVKPAHIV